MMQPEWNPGEECLIVTVQSNATTPVIEILAAKTTEDGLAESIPTKEWGRDALRRGTPFATKEDANTVVLTYAPALLEAHAAGSLKNRRLGLVVSDEPLLLGAACVVDVASNRLHVHRTD